MTIDFLCYKAQAEQLASYKQALLKAGWETLTWAFYPSEKHNKPFIQVRGNHNGQHEEFYYYDKLNTALAARIAWNTAKQRPGPCSGGDLELAARLERTFGGPTEW